VIITALQQTNEMRVENDNLCLWMTMNQSLAKLNLLKKKAPIPKEKWMNPKKKREQSIKVLCLLDKALGPY
jgi:hypothetical protein